MADVFPPEQRSRVMRAVHTVDTGPELRVRRLLHRLGYRYRLHRQDLPGKPDIVFPARKSVIFVHGCFWHGHDCRRGARLPKTNSDYWRGKIGRNVARDSSHRLELEQRGWRVLTLWECELKDEAELRERLQGFLDTGPGRLSS